MTSSDPSATPSTESMSHGGAAAQPFRWPIALIGAFVASLGLSGVIDDSGLIGHPWWAVILVAAIVGCGLGIVTSVRSLGHDPTNNRADGVG